MSHVTKTAATPGPFACTVLKVVDGDTVKVEVPAWKGTPFFDISLRLFGIDTPESHMPPAKCMAEVALGQRAASRAKELLKPGDAVEFIFRHIDKYGGRIDADIKLPDGRDFATVMMGEGLCRAYDGGTKSNWCV